MRSTLRWTVPGEVFEDGSRLAEWIKIESHPWQWQYDAHELAFDIYEHDGQYWKLYRARWVPEGTTEYVYDYGGQACRMMLVEYTTKARSPHSKKPMQPGDLEWVRTYEYDGSIHRTVKGARQREKDHAPK